MKLLSKHLQQAAGGQARLPVELFSKDGVDQILRDLEHKLHSGLRGQDEAVQGIRDALLPPLRVMIHRINAQARTLDLPKHAPPLATLFLAGPTGTGKTWSAEAIASSICAGKLTVLNCSDVGEENPHGISEWVGAPPGFVGYLQGGMLTNALREAPFRVVVFDEVEKASRETITNVLLPLLGAGIVTDRNTGESLSCGNTIVVCTSNVLLTTASEQIGFQGNRNDATSFSTPRETLIEAGFRRELVGRLGSMVEFKPFELATKKQIWADLLATHLEQVDAGYKVDLDESAIALLDQHLEGIETGARGVKDLLATELLPLLFRSPADSRTIVVTTVDRRFRLKTSTMP